MDANVSKINILNLVSDLGYAGGARNMVAFARLYDRRFFNVCVASYGAGGASEAVLQREGIPYMVAEHDIARIIDFVKSQKVQIIVFSRSGGYVAWESEFLRAVREFDATIRIIERNVFGKYDSQTAAFFDVRFFQSKMHLNERFLPVAGEPFQASRHKVLYNVVDEATLAPYTLSANEIGELKRTWGIGTDDFVVGKIARAHIAKWSDLVLDMMPYLVRLVPKVKLVLVGVPASRVRRIARSSYHKHVIILPESADEKWVHHFYQVIDVLAHSSKIGECNGNTINEARYWKKPVVVHSTPKRDNGQLEQVVHMHDGIVANFPSTYARAIAYLAAHPQERTQYGDRARVGILQHNAPQAIVPQIEKAAVEILQAAGAAVDLSVINRYTTVQFSPSAEAIMAYQKEYIKRAVDDFGCPTVAETVSWYLRFPIRLFYKVYDYIAHNYLHLV